MLIFFWIVNTAVLISSQTLVPAENAFMDLRSSSLLRRRRRVLVESSQTSTPGNRKQSARRSIYCLGSKRRKTAALSSSKTEPELELHKHAESDQEVIPDSQPDRGSVPKQSASSGTTQTSNINNSRNIRLRAPKSAGKKNCSPVQVNTDEQPNAIVSEREQLLKLLCAREAQGVTGPRIRWEGSTGVVTLGDEQENFPMIKGILCLFVGLYEKMQEREEQYPSQKRQVLFVREQDVPRTVGPGKDIDGAEEQSMPLVDLEWCAGRLTLTVDVGPWEYTQE